MSQKNYSPIFDYFDISYTPLIKTLHKNTDYNNYSCEDICGNQVQLHYKSIPLVDYVKLMIGKYKSCNILVLPEKNAVPSNKYETYINSIHNYAYVDSFFYHISNKIPDFIHLIALYDSYIEIQNNCEVNMVDD